ncbi:endo-beta-1,4-glucanase D 9 [Colletotrichum truncatum]|uniref:Endo-beta-1,4-glucanase D 9 n=1 Tax=Colletotrichum truncatum TaxID=5467 RepID=A0ACC3ZBL8_COLTU|nr:endo-beta-1,4-glucanase D 9 [Colletotrichum truncatum]KAF6787850.1 endo-beta-1,4-glucanase D 9 [Colletotrichum truncatum]
MTKFQSALALLATVGALPSALAHYNFERLIVNGNDTGPYEYVRRTTNSNGPIEDVTSLSMVCNQGGLDADIMAATNIHTVAAGDEVGFGMNEYIGHPGPTAVYMSKAPEGVSAAEYKGDGDWFKVYDLTYRYIDKDYGPQWGNYVSKEDIGVRNFTFKLPDQLPPGDYLMRGEHVALHAAGDFGKAQFYMGCAQLRVTGSGTGTPEPLVKIPGVYTGREPGILIGIFWPPPQNYTVAGPPAWPNGCEDHTVNLNGQESDGDCSPTTVPAGVTAAVPSTGAPTATAVVPSSSASEAPVTTSVVPTPSASASASQQPSVEVPVPSANATVPGANTCAEKAARRRAMRARRAHLH